MLNNERLTSYLNSIIYKFIDRRTSSEWNSSRLQDCLLWTLILHSGIAWLTFNVSDTRVSVRLRCRLCTMISADPYSKTNIAMP